MIIYFRLYCTVLGATWTPKYLHVICVYVFCYSPAPSPRPPPPTPSPAHNRCSLVICVVWMQNKRRGSNNRRRRKNKRRTGGWGWGVEGRGRGGGGGWGLRKRIRTDCPPDRCLPISSSEVEPELDSYSLAARLAPAQQQCGIRGKSAREGDQNYHAFQTGLNCGCSQPGRGRRDQTRVPCASLARPESSVVTTITSLLSWHPSRPPSQPPNISPSASLNGNLTQTR